MFFSLFSPLRFSFCYLNRSVGKVVWDFMHFAVHRKSGHKSCYHKNCVYYTIHLRQNQHFFATFSFKIANSFVCTNSTAASARFLVNSPKQPVVSLFLPSFPDFCRILPQDLQICCERKNRTIFPFQPPQGHLSAPRGECPLIRSCIADIFAGYRVSSFISAGTYLFGVYGVSGGVCHHILCQKRGSNHRYGTKSPDGQPSGHEKVTGFPSKRPQVRQNRRSAIGLCPHPPC